MGAFVVPALRLLLWTRPPQAPLKPSSPRLPALWPSQVTLTWSSGYIGGCVCGLFPSTFPLWTLPLQDPLLQGHPIGEGDLPSHFCFQCFLMDVPSTHISPFMGWLDLPSVAQRGWMSRGSARSSLSFPFLCSDSRASPPYHPVIKYTTKARHLFLFRKAQTPC